MHVHWFGCVQGLWSGFSKKVPQEHLATSNVMPVVRFTCCEHLSKLPTDSLLQDRSSCQFGELFRKHRLVFTGPVWIAGHVAPPNKCRTVNSSKLRVTMISWKPTYMHLACELTSPDFTDNGSKPSKAKWWARMTAVPMALDSVYLM